MSEGGDDVIAQGSGETHLHVSIYRMSVISPIRLCLVPFFQSAWFTVNPPVRAAKVNDGLPQLDVTSYSALIIKKGTFIFGLFSQNKRGKNQLVHERARCLTPLSAERSSSGHSQSLSCESPPVTVGNFC